MNPHTLNGERLLRQGRHNEAADAFRQTLASDPQDWRTHALLALALQSAGDETGAGRSAHEAVRLAPGEPFAHYTLGMTALFAGDLSAAERSAGEAVRLDPDNAEHYRLMALVRADQRRWAEALGLVDRGLRIDPEDTACLNLRSQLLVRLRRTREAREVAGQALASDPDDADSHANAGWAALHHNKAKDALGHFREALRIEPGHDWAKAGLAEALKARNPLYRVLLGLMLWLIRLDPRVRVAVIVGGYVLYRAGLAVSKDNPGLAPWVWPLLALYLIMAWMTWVGMPLADLLLRASRYGRHALSPHQRRVSSVLGLFILAAATALVLWLTLDARFSLDAAIDLALLSLITVGTLQLYRAPRYKLLRLGCGVLAMLMLGNWLSVALENPGLHRLTRDGFIYGFIGMMWFVALGGAGSPRRAG